MTQAERLVKELRKGWHTWWGLQCLVGQSPQKRLAESGRRFLKPGEFIDRKIMNGLVHLRVRRATK